MRRFYFLFLLLITAASAQEIQNRVTATILEIQGSYLYFPALDFKAGESGYVVRELGENRTAIIGRASILSIKDGKAMASSKGVEDLFKQKAFPSLDLSPKEGDKVMFRSFNDRGIIIAPHQRAYQKVQDLYPAIQWIHADLLASNVLREGRYAPLLEDLRKTCDTYSIGLVYLVMGDLLQVRDCQSFTLLKSEKHPDLLQEGEVTITPFFSRLGTVERGFWARLFGKRFVADYIAYYKALTLGEPKDSDSFYTALHRHLLTKATQGD